MARARVEDERMERDSVTQRCVGKVGELTSCIDAAIGEDVECYLRCVLFFVDRLSLFLLL